MSLGTFLIYFALPGMLIFAFFVFIIVFVVSGIIKRTTASKRIMELTVYADGLKRSVAQATDENTKKIYEKKLIKVEDKIEDLKLFTTQKKNYTSSQKLRCRYKLTRRLLILTVMITVAGSYLTVSFYHLFDSYKEHNLSLYREIYDLETEINDLEIKNIDLEYKFEWYNESARIVIADEGPLYKTYHTFDCEKWEDHSFWIYNKAQVIDNYEYTKCTDCNKE